MKFSVMAIVTDHIDTMKDFDTGKLGFEGIATLVALPLIAGIGAAVAHPELTEVERAALIVFFAMFAATLPILVLQMPRLLYERKEDGFMAELRAKMVSETVTNAAFGVVVSFAAISALMLDAVVTVKYMSVFLCYSHVLMLVLTLRMTAKRLYILVGKEVNAPVGRR